MIEADRFLCIEMSHQIHQLEQKIPDKSQILQKQTKIKIISYFSLVLDLDRSGIEPMKPNNINPK